MTDPANAVHWRASAPGEAPAPGSGPLDVADAARWLASAPGASPADLDPALMAWMGPGTCTALAVIVVPAGEAGPDEGVPLARALELAPAVASHVAECDACSDRLRAMVSVGELLSRESPAGAAGALATGAHAVGPIAATAPARRPGWPRRPGPGGEPASVGRRTRTVAVAGAAALAAAAGIAYLAWPSGTGPAAGPATATAITRIPPGGSSLLLDPAATRTGVLQLSDVGARPVTWQATTTAPWLRVAPTTGQLAPGQQVRLALNVVGNQATGLRATVTVNGDDGSVTAAQYRP